MLRSFIILWLCLICAFETMCRITWLATRRLIKLRLVTNRVVEWSRVGAPNLLGLHLTTPKFFNLQLAHLQLRVKRSHNQSLRNLEFEHCANFCLNREGYFNLFFACLECAEGVSQEGKKLCVLHELMQLGVWVHYELLNGFSGWPWSKAFENFTIFSLKLVCYNFLKIKLILSVSNKKLLTLTFLLWCDYNKQTKAKLEDEKNFFTMYI